MPAFVTVTLIGLLVMVSSLGAAQSDYETRRCERIDPSDPCYRDLAVSRSDPQICRLIEFVSTRNNCYSKIAQNTNDKTLCLDVRQDRGSFDDKYTCYEEFITGIEDMDFCIKDLKGDEETMDECLLKIALKEGDAMLCDSLSFEDAQMECIVGIAVKSQDESLCQLIRTKIDMKQCKSQEGKGCGTREEIDEARYECEHKILIEKRRNVCRSRSGVKELNLDEGEDQDISFRGHDEPIHLKYTSASLSTNVGVFDVTVGSRTQEITLQPGMTGKNRFINVYLVELVERGTEEAPEGPRMSLCLFPDPLPRLASPPRTQEPEQAPEPESPEPEQEVPVVTTVEQESIVDNEPAKSSEVVSPTTRRQAARPTFFEWLGGLIKGVGGFLKKILI